MMYQPVLDVVSLRETMTMRNPVRFRDGASDTWTRRCGCIAEGAGAA
jgi:hypothetical protein